MDETPPKRAVTMRDVAAAAGVHQSTASRAIQGDRRIRAEVRDKVLQCADALGYRPNPFNATGGPSWVTTDGSLANTGAAADGFFTGSNFTLTLGNLTAGQNVSLNLFASRDSASSVGYYEYSLNGGDTWLGFNVFEKNGAAATTDGWNSNTTASQTYNNQSQGFTLARYMGTNTVALTGTTLQVRVTNTSGFALLNAIQLTTNVVPEPSTAALLAGSLGPTPQIGTCIEMQPAGATP